MNRFRNRVWGWLCMMVIAGLLAACGTPAATQTESPAATQPEAAPPQDTATPQIVYVEITPTP